MIRLAARALVMFVVVTGITLPAHAHDPSAYGGLFRSRDLGATWLNADIGLFLNAALVVAIDPRDPNHLLLGTDTGLLSSNNGGRSWVAEHQGSIAGPVFAVAFSPTGEEAICAAPTGVFRLDKSGWRRSAAPDGAAPARAVVFGATPGRVYLAGRDGLFASDDRGQSFRRISGLARGSEITALTVLAAAKELLLAVVDGRLVASGNGGETWSPVARAPAAAAIDTSTADPQSPNRLWAASADRIAASEDLGEHWRILGNPLPEPQTNIRGIASDAAGATLVVTTHRGLYRSTDAGAHWELKESNLPVHLEAGPLARDPRDPQTLYAVYSLMPYAVVWRTALEGGNLLSRVDPVSLAGGFAFLLLLLLGGASLVAWLARWRAAVPTERGSS